MSQQVQPCADLKHFTSLRKLEEPWEGRGRRHSRSVSVCMQILTVTQLPIRQIRHPETRHVSVVGAARAALLLWLSGNVPDQADARLKRPDASLSGHKWPLLHNQPISIPWVLFLLERGGGQARGLIDAEALR